MILKTKELSEERVFARHEGNFMYADKDKINYVDLSPKQLVSVSTALIPFLEHDDAISCTYGIEHATTSGSAY